MEQPDNPYRKIKVLQAEGGRKPIPPFEMGDIVEIVPFRGCNVGAEFCRVPLEIIMIERAAVEPEIAWDIDLGGCPYMITYPLPDGDDYTLRPVKLIRDQII